MAVVYLLSSKHKEEKVLIPTLIFVHLLTSSNYNDDEKKVTGNKRMTFMVIDLNFLKDANLTTVILSYLNRECDLVQRFRPSKIPDRFHDRLKSVIKTP